MSTFTRRYRVRRIAPLSALRFGCLLGWLAMLPPAVVIAWLGLQAIRAVHATISQIQPLELGEFFGQSLGQLNLLELFQLSAITDAIARMAEQQTSTFLMLLLLVLVAGSLALSVAALLVSLGYNLLAALTGGLVLDLSEEA